MVGPSGVDAPAPPAQHLDDAFRAVSALSQGDPDRAASIIVQMGDGEFAELRRIARSLDAMTAREHDARQRTALIARVTEHMPTCMCEPGSIQHTDGCPRAVEIGPSAPLADGILPRPVPAPDGELPIERHSGVEGAEHFRRVYPSNGPGPFYACGTCRDAAGGLVPWPCPPAAASLARRS